MKINVCCIYWTLLFVSFVSSCLLFILVATENINDIDNAKTVEDNITINEHINSISKKLEIEEISKLTKLDVEPHENSQLSGDQESKSHENKTPIDQKQDVYEEIHTSFEEVVSSSNVISSQAKDSLPNVAATDSRADISKDLSETGQAVVFTLVDSATSELQQRASLRTEGVNLHEAPGGSSNASTPPAPQPIVVLDEVPDTGNESDTGDEDKKYVVRAEPRTPEVKPPEAVPEQPEEETVPVPSANESSSVSGDQQTTEDIPSFSEWAQKQLAEAEKNMQNVTAPPNDRDQKLRLKNYASPDCGAKIVAANPEAGSAGSVLSNSRDEYMLNTCTSRIWFIVELCEAIQAQKIELANFELFSSSPRDFSVSVSDRFPSRDWRGVGQFNAEDERTIQSFGLAPTLFGKFVKVELLSHYGAEHFCPVSLFRVYGKSEFEVLETEDGTVDPTPDPEEDEPLIPDRAEPPKNLFGSARDAVMSIVKKAAEALVKGGDSEERHSGGLASTDSASEEWCVTPSHIVVCDNCSDAMYASVYHLLSCHGPHLYTLLLTDFVRDAMLGSELCLDYGLDFTSSRRGAPYPLRPSAVDRGGYLSALLPSHYIAAFCNVLAVLEHKVVYNMSFDSPEPLTNLSSKTRPGQDIGGLLISPATTCTVDPTQRPCTPPSTPGYATRAPQTVVPEEPSLATQIKPTRTLTQEEGRPGSMPASTATSNTTVSNPPPTEQPPPAPPASTDNLTVEVVVLPPSTSDQDVPSDSDPSEASLEQLSEDSLDTLLLDLKALDLDSSPISVATTTSVPPHSHPPAQQVHKESVFLRLSNRIKALERNMSLSGQYLEELSRRYKKQVEEMQRAFDRTLTAMAEESRRGQERDQRRLEEVTTLRQQLAALTNSVHILLQERDSWQHKAGVVMQHALLIALEMCVFAIILYFCRRAPVTDDGDEVPWQGQPSGVPQRRKSLEVVRESPRLKYRRPSEEALNISGSYHELMIKEAELDGAAQNKKRRRKRKELPGKAEAGEERRSSDTTSPRLTRSENLPRRSSASELVRYFSVESSETEHSYSVPSTVSPSHVRELVAPAAPQQQGNGLVKSSQGPKMRRLSSPTFLKTATATRNNRRPAEPRLKSDNWEWYSGRRDCTPDRTSSSGGGGLKKIVKKFF